MVSRNQFIQFNKRILSAALLLVLACALAIPSQVFARQSASVVPSLSSFIESIKDGSPNTLRGIYVEDLIASPIVRQPYGKPGFVSASSSEVTQFSSASEAGNLGLLAHNTLAGATFSRLKAGDVILLIYGNGRTQGFVVEDIQQYQALDPLNPYSDFKDLAKPGTLSAQELFNKVYRGKYHLTLQTCIEYDGNFSWGRLFVIAKPISGEALEYWKLNYREN